MNSPSQGELEKLTRVVANQNAQLRALNEANLLLSEERLVSSVLQRVVDLSRELAGARYAAIGVLGDDAKLKSFFASGIDQDARKAIGDPPTGKGLLGLMMGRAEPIRADNIQDHPASVGFPPAHPPMTTFLGIPIRHKGLVVGSIYLTDKEGGSPFTDEDEEIIRLFANQAAVAIHNAHMNEQIQALAVETERTRISREIHDGLAQVLGYVNTKAQAVEGFLANGDVAAATVHLGEMSHRARLAYRDVREGILALRSQVGTERSLSEALGEYIEEYQQQLGPSAMVHQDITSDLDLSPLQEVQILRVVQEALTNVRKHARATEIWVRFTQRGVDLVIEVKDNGQGFNPLAIKRGEWPHLGLQTMQERAEAIGGAFEINSSPGNGTTVGVTVPYAQSAGPRGREQ